MNQVTAAIFAILLFTPAFLPLLLNWRRQLIYLPVFLFYWVLVMGYALQGVDGGEPLFTIMFGFLFLVAVFILSSVLRLVYDAIQYLMGRRKRKKYSLAFARVLTAQIRVASTTSQDH